MPSHEDRGITILTSRPEGATQPSAVAGGANPDAAVPFVFGRSIAQGGMGSILEAQDCKIGRTIAVKVMLSELNAEEDQKQRFINEAAVLGRLEHPNIVPIHDLGRTRSGELYYTMKLVKGRTLKGILHAIRDGDAETLKHHTLERLLTIFRKVCDAMAFSHAHGIIHRDLKPENIMVGEFGEVLVMDWGLAKILQGGAAPAGRLSMQLTPEQQAALDAGGTNFSMTLEGEVMGTPQYMSPEQADGRIADIDARSDIFSLGGILYTILTLRPPVTGRGFNEILRNVATGNIASPTEFGASGSKGRAAVKGRVVDKDASKPLPHCPGGRVPAALSAVAMKALTVAREKRYQEVAALNADIEKYQGGFATGAEHAGAWKQFALLMKRNKAASLATAVGLVLLAGVSSAFTMRVLQERDRAEHSLADLRKTAPTFAAQATGLVEQGDLEAALEKIGYAVSLDLGNADYLLQQANLFQATQQLTEAAEAYRGLLKLRPDHAAAKLNLALCEKLLRDNAGSTELKRESQGELAAAMIQQGRVVEAAPLSSIVGEESDTALAAIRARLKPLTAMLGARAGASRLPNGSYRLSFRAKPVVDIPPLGGLPVTEIDVSQTKVSDLSPLKGLRLKSLDVSQALVSDLSPLAGMPLERLDTKTFAKESAGIAKIVDLTPLKGMPLVELDLHGSDVSDLSPLRGAPLKKLSAGTTKLSDLRPLAGMRLEQIDVSSTSVADLTPLAGMQVQSLKMTKTLVTDVSPLRGMPLQYLALTGTSVMDLSPLAGMPLEELYLMQAKGADISVLRTLPLKKLNLQGTFKDLRPLADCKTLETLTIPKVNSDISFLRTLPNLQRISHESKLVSSPRMPTAEQFWKEYDAERAAEKK